MSLGVSLVPPSKPTVSLVSDTSVQLKWSIGQSEGLNVTLFKVQFKEIKTRKHRKSAGWHTIDEDIAPDVSEFTVSNLKPGLFDNECSVSHDHWALGLLAMICEHSALIAKLHGHGTLLAMLNYTE